MIDEDDCGVIGGMKIGRGNRSTRRKSAPAPLCPPQIPHDQTRAWTPGRRGVLIIHEWVIVIFSVVLCITFKAFRSPANSLLAKKRQLDTGHKINRNITRELRIPLITEFTEQYRNMWGSHSEATPSSSLKVKWRFGGTCRLRFQGRRKIQPRNQHEAGSKQS
jgi:hypothetical protein